MDNAVYNLEFVIKDQPPITVRTDGSSESDAVGKAWAWILQFHERAIYVSHRFLDDPKGISQLKGKERH